jgi:hypothetical protein
MVVYSQFDLNKRDMIFQSQKQFWSFLDSTMINKLVHLFDTKSKNSPNKISNYIENERNRQGLETNNISVIGEVYGQKEKRPTLYLGIKKYNKDFVHITFHLVPKLFDPQHNGPIHFVKNVYDIEGKKSFYALISIIQPTNKPKSLEFIIADGYTTSGVKNAHIYDSGLQKEMNVIITVLNRMFDEDNSEFYIGNENKLVSIHNNTNTILDNINRSSQTVKNKGTRMYPPLNNTLNSIKIHKYSKTLKNRSTRMYPQINNKINSIKRYKNSRKTLKRK